MGSRLARALCTLAIVQSALVAFAEERQIVTVWGLSAGPDAKGAEAVVREFEKRNPDLKVRALRMGAGEMNPQKLMTSIVGNAPPDVIYQDRFSLSDWASRGAFRPLDDLMARDKANPLNPRPEQYFPAAWAETQYEGKTYAIPSGSDTRVLYWNRRIFRQNADALRAAGLDPGRPPRTWSETLQYSKVLTKRDANGQIVAAGFIPNYGNSWLYLFAFQNDAQFMSADGRTCTLDTPAAREAVEFMVKGYDLLGGYDNAQKFSSGFLGNENDPFVIGKVAMKVDGDWILSNLSRYAPDLDFGVAPPPVPDDRFARRGRFKDDKDLFITWMGGFSYGVPVGAKNVEGAWRYIKFAASAEGRLIEVRAQADWDKLRGREFIQRVQAHREANEEILRQYAPKQPNYADAVSLHVAIGEVGRIRPPTVVGQVLWDEHIKAFEAACRHELPPDRALKRGQSVVQRELDAHYRYFSLPQFDMRVPLGIGATAFLALVAGFVVWIRRQKLGRLAREETKWAYILLSPWLLGFFIFTAGPMLASLAFSMTQYNVLSDPKWVGAENYVALFTSERENLVKAFGNVFYLAGIGVPLGIVSGLLIALLLNTSVRGINTYRTIFYLPSIVPVVAGAVLWSWVLTPDPSKGLVNAAWLHTVTEWLGVSPPGWLTVADWAKPALITMGVWGAGGGMILWLAGLKGVPKTLYEAASLDGANPVTQFFSVTLPMLSPIVFFNVVTGLINSMQEFDRVWVLRGNTGSSGPSDSLLVPVVHLFVNGFTYFKLGFASALAWLIFAVILTLTLVQMRLRKRWVFAEGDR
ncbi:MAG: extracellular solute-binding protein [Fimbriimonadaceae bacterium]|nr:extracellular solute-binding protein [Fimbriimonadaceae bacterium]QYK55582.1 MAG: extracellular solute-binding protein [Fimbriimonadaceae bacterium]